jgi:acyl carrier protein
MFSSHFFNFENVWQAAVLVAGIVRVSTSNQDRVAADEAIYERLTVVFRNIFEDSSISLRLETSESDIPGWDSFSNASLVAAMEKEFSIRFRTAELQSMHNVGSFVDLIRTKLQERS